VAGHYGQPLELRLCDEHAIEGIAVVRGKTPGGHRVVERDRHPLLQSPHLHLERMSVLEQVQSDVKDAMKAGERERVHALRLIVSELQKAAKDNGGDEIQVLQRERKRRLEAAEAYRDGGRADAAEAEEREAEIIASYLPAQLSDEELDAIVGDAVAESGASSPGEMGKVMGLVMPKVQGRADGKRVSAAVREKLAP
jgi:uncharacterized protein